MAVTQATRAAQSGGRKGGNMDQASNFDWHGEWHPVNEFLANWHGESHPVNEILAGKSGDFPDCLKRTDREEDLLFYAITAKFCERHPEVTIKIIEAIKDVPSFGGEATT